MKPVKNSTGTIRSLLKCQRPRFFQVDQLSMEQPHHLSIKDIGIILERLSSKIIDVERLDRSSEGSDTRNWTLKATIRGDVMRELGVIYNNNYYAISEHPGYSRNLDDVVDDEDVDDDDYDDDDKVNTGYSSNLSF